MTDQNKTPAESSAPALSVVAGSVKWAYASHPTSEKWYGPFDTEHEATVAALGDFGDPDDGFRPCLSRCRPIRADEETDGEDWTFVCVGAVEEIEMLSSPNTEVTDAKRSVE